MKILIVFTAICFFSGFSIAAQDANNLNIKTSMSAFDSPINIAKAGFWVPKSTSVASVVGSVYLFDNWNGLYTIIGVNKNATQVSNLNYNLQTKTLESTFVSDSIFQYDMSEIDYVKNGSTIYKVINNGQVNGLFSELVVNTHFQIYKEIELSIKKGTFDRLSQVKIKEDQYVKVPIYYLVQDGVFQRQKFNKKAVLQLTGGQKEAVDKFVSTNNLSYSKESDLIRILIYYGSIKA